MRRGALIGLAAVSLGVAACSGEGNTGRPTIDPALIAEVPWVNGAPPLIDPATSEAIVPAAPVFPPIKFGTPDPGSRVLFDTPEHRATACAPLANIEVSQWHHDFEPVGGGMVGVAQFFSAYDDKTDGSWHVPGDASWYATTAPLRGLVMGPTMAAGAPPWGLVADTIQNGPSCDGSPNNWALHVKGGRFNYFGGGAAHPLELDCRNGGQQEACDRVVDAVGDGRLDKVIDVSDYDGVAFWARRGPDSESMLGVGLSDKYTEDRLARSGDGGTPGVGWCKRIKQCYPTCADGASCVPVQAGDEATPTYRCVPEGAKPADAVMEPALLQQLYPPCGQSACKPPSYDPDPDFDNTQCKPYNFTGLDENYYCYGDTPPPPADQRCNDGFVQSVSLSTDWTFYTVPFDRFGQQGYGKKAPPNDNFKRSLYSIYFLFPVGWTDFYVDNLTFYRNK